MAVREKLTGDALVSHMENCKGMPTADIVKGAGYWRKNGEKISILFTQFWAAYAAAQGQPLADAKPVATTSRKANGVLKQGKRGLVPLSGAYTRVLGVEDGGHVFVDTLDPGQTMTINGPAVICRNATEVEQAEATPAPARQGIPPVLQVA